MMKAALLLASLVAPAIGLKALVLPQDFADSFGAKCLDGTPPVIYYSLHPNATTTVMFLEGGGCA